MSKYVCFKEQGVVVPQDYTTPSLSKMDPDDAGYDVFALEDRWIFPFFIRKVPVNAIIEIPRGYYGRVVGRSGETMNGNVVIEGTIDAGYRGIFNALMVRFGLLPRRIRKGDKIAQIIITPFVNVSWLLGTEQNLTPSRRSKKGFGHSGYR